MREKHKVFVRLAGGLGNQIFQMAFAVHLASRANAHLVYSTAGLGTYESVHDYVLDGVLDMSSYVTSAWYSKYIVPLRMPRLLPLCSPYLTLASDRNMVSVMKRRPSRVQVLDGYFQEVPLELLRALPLLPAFRALEPEMADTDLVIHVRGGDFVRLGYTDNRIDKFYAAALARIGKHGGIQKPVIVTDDAEFVAGLPSLRGIDIRSEGTIRDFARICFAQNRIFGSSTFALSAAAIGQTRGINVSTGTWLKGEPRAIFLENESAIRL